MGGAATPPDGATVAILIAGLPRSFLSAPVRDTFREHVRAALPSSDVFVGLVCCRTSAERERTRLEVSEAYWPLRHLLFLPEKSRLPRMRCALPFSFASKVLLQWLPLSALFDAVEAAEAARRRQYEWIVRTRTDIVYLAAITLPAAGLPEASRPWLPVGGMNADPRARCTLTRLLWLLPRRFMLRNATRAAFCSSTQPAPPWRSADATD